MKLFDEMMVSEARIAESAEVMGFVEIGKDSSVWYKTVIRGDEEKIVIGKNTNIQELCSVHVDKECPVFIGDGVTIGHGCIIHGCQIGDNTLIGMGSIVLNGAKIGKNCIIGAGSLVTQGMVVPDGTLMFGSPAKFIRNLTDAEIEANRKSAMNYADNAKIHF